MEEERSREGAARPGRRVVEFFHSIKARDLDKIRQIVEKLESRGRRRPSPDNQCKYSFSSSSYDDDVRFLVEISEAVAQVTYKKGSAKDRFRDLPWPNLGYLHVVLKAEAKPKEETVETVEEGERARVARERREVRRGLCALAVPRIIEEDLPELHARLSSLLRHQARCHTPILSTACVRDDEEMEVFDGGTVNEESILRTVVTAPPATGLVHLVKLTQYFLDELQLSSLLEHLRSLVRCPYTGSRLQKYALMRMLTIVGESTKYLSPHLKAADPTIPWKNIEKVRDLLSHVSRVPIREAVQSILEEREVRGANLAEDATAATTSLPDQEQTNATSVQKMEKTKTTSKELEEESTFERAAIQLPPNLLRDVYEVELVALTHKFEDLQRYHSSFLFVPAPASSSLLRIFCATVIALITFYLFSSLLLTFVMMAALGGSAIALSAKPGTTPAERRTRDANSLWQALPLPAVYSPQSLELKRYAKLKERSLEEKLKRQRDASHDGEVELMLCELTDAMCQKRREAAADNGNDDGDQTTGAESALEEVDVYRRALRGESRLDKAQAKALWTLITDKSARKRWAERLYGKSRSTKRVKPKDPGIDGDSDDEGEQAGNAAVSNSGQRRKLARMRHLVELHQNSTLNKEGKRHHELRKFVLLRKFLQSPTKTKEDQSTLCIKFIIATLREVQQLLADELPAFLAWTLERRCRRGTGNGPRAAGASRDDERDSNADEEKRRQAFEDATLLIREHPLLQYALHFQIGIYALYAAQVKWCYPELLGVEHIEMRDSVMHGSGLSYEHHLTDAGIASMLGHLVLMLLARPSLEAALIDLRTHDDNNCPSS